MAARVVNMPGRDVRFPVGNAAMASGWIAEKGARATTASPDFTGVVPPGGELYAAPQMTLASVEDAAADLEGFVQTCVADEFARNESEAFITGDGVDKPRGFLTGTPVATSDASRAVGVLQYIPTGNATTLGADPIGVLIATVMAMKAGYRGAPGCGWMMSTVALSTIMNLKDTTGRPIYLPSMREGVPGTLLGYPVFEAEQMPVIGANNFPIAFGNWQRGYVVGDRAPLSMLRDPYTTRGFLTMYFRKRVHGSVLNSEAIKLVRVSTT
jgi:HK97 family phage major capsid protein